MAADAPSGPGPRHGADGGSTEGDGHPLTGDFALLARLAFATREVQAKAAREPLPLALLPADALDMDLQDPAQRDFGDYELLEKIGQGGMGVVYRAYQRSLQREVALKLLAAGPWASPDFVERFRREAQSAALLEHPNIVTVFESGTQHDLHFFSMRLVRGQSLAERLHAERTLPAREAARLLRIVAEALDYAHRLGVLHLDLKPGNVLIDASGEPLVADFGLARRMDQALAEQGDDVSGTPSYMAPEQAQAHSQRIGRATDIYGLGAILYETLTGRPPFLAATPQATLRKVVDNQLVHPRELAPQIPRDLEAVCLKCLHKDPEQRYPSASALADDLRAWLEDRAVSVRRPTTAEGLQRWVRREPRLALALGGMLATLAVGLIATAQQWWRAEDSAAAARALLWEGRRDAALQLAQEGRGFDAMERLLANLAEQETEAVADGNDRRQLGLLLGQGAVLIDRMAIADANPLSAALSPSGARLVLGFNDLTVRWYDTATLTERGRVLLDRPYITGEVRAPLLLRFIAEDRLQVTAEWSTVDISPNNLGSWLVDLSRAAVIEPPPEFPGFGDAAFSADGSHALLRNDRFEAQLWKVDPWAPVSGVLQPRANSAIWSTNLSWLVDNAGRVLAESEFGQRAITLHDATLTARMRVELPEKGVISAWAMSPDGRQIALGEYEGRLHLLDTASGRLRTLPASRGRELSWLEFSPDGSWLASASPSGAAHVYDAATGDMLGGGALLHDHSLRRVHIDSARRLLVAEGEGRVGVWRLPLSGPREAPAQRLALGPSAHTVAGRFAVGVALDSGLVATAGIDGQVRLWRLPGSHLLPARGSHQFAEGSGFSGSEVIDLAWDRLSIVGSGRDVRAVRTLATPPGFAEMVQDGSRLLMTLGPQLHAWDARDLRPVLSPVELPASPQRLAISEDGTRIVASFAARGPGGGQESLRVIDGVDGAMLATSPDVPAPLRRLVMDAKGERVLTVGPGDDAVRVLDARSLETIGEFPHDPYAPVQWADFAANGEVLLVMRAPDPRLGQDFLVRWDPPSDAVLEEVATGDARPLGVIGLPDGGAFVAGSGRDLVVRHGRATELPRRARSQPTAVLAVSPGLGLLARGYRREVQLHDAVSGEPIGAPLQGEVNAVDTIVRLQFSDEGRSLLARTLLGHWQRWPIGAEERPVAELRALHAAATWASPDQSVLYAPGTPERIRLRRGDPGPPASAPPRPALPVAVLTEFGDPVPERAQAAGAGGQLDLSPWYDIAPETVLNPFWSVVPHLRPMPAGYVRAAGVDFDVRGIVQINALDWVTPGADSVRSRGVECVPVPARPVAEVVLLMTSTMPLPQPTGVELAHVRLRYRDGGQRVLPLRAGHELHGHAGDDAAVPHAFAPDISGPLLGYSSPSLSAPRLANPEPERLLRCIDVVSAGEPSRPLMLLAATVNWAGPAMAGNPDQANR